MCDNTTAIACINNMGDLKSRITHAMAQQTCENAAPKIYGFLEIKNSKIQLRSKPSIAYFTDHTKGIIPDAIVQIFVARWANLPSTYSPPGFYKYPGSSIMQPMPLTVFALAKLQKEDNQVIL